MTECTNDAMRDLLPLLAHDALDAAGTAAVRAHLAGCVACVAELALIEHAARAFDAAAPTMRIDAIVRALPAPPAQVPSLKLVPRRRSGPWMPRPYLAAASLLLVGVLSLSVVRGYFDGSTPDGGIADSGQRVALAVPVDLIGGSDLAGLDAAELAELLAELDQWEATVAADPMAIRQPLVPTPEGI